MQREVGSGCGLPPFSKPSAIRFGYLCLPQGAHNGIPCARAISGQTFRRIVKFRHSSCGRVEPLYPGQPCRSLPQRQSHFASLAGTNVELLPDRILKSPSSLIRFSDRICSHRIHLYRRHVQPDASRALNVNPLAHTTSVGGSSEVRCRRFPGLSSITETRTADIGCFQWRRQFRSCASTPPLVSNVKLGQSLFVRDIGNPFIAKSATSEMKSS